MKRFSKIIAFESLCSALCFALLGYVLGSRSQPSMVVDTVPENKFVARSEQIYRTPDVQVPAAPRLEGNSRFEDERGVYERRCFGLPEICVNILFTRKGYLRSGDLHRSFQVNHILYGSVKLTVAAVYPVRKDLTFFFHQRQTITIRPDVPHLYEFLEDTIMTEHWTDEHGNFASFRAWLYTPYRNLIPSHSTAKSFTNTSK